MRTDPPPAQNTHSSDDRLTTAIARARKKPEEPGVWDALDELAASTQRPDEIAKAYRDVLTTELGPTLLAELGQRAVQFHEEWYGEGDKGLNDVLGRVLDADPNAEWAFQRLTVIHTVAERWDDL